MFRLRLAVVLAAHLLIVLGLAGAVLWGSGEGHQYVDRLRLAHGNLKEYLSLMQQTQRHFQSLRDQVVYGRTAEAFDAAASRRELDDTLRMLQADTQREVDLVERGEELAEEIAELKRLDAIGRELDAADGQFAAAAELAAAGRAEEARALVAEVLETRVVGRIEAMIGEATQIEAEEVDEAVEEANDVLMRMSNVAQVAAFAAVVLILVAAFVLVVRLRRPIDRLIDGTEKLSSGALENRIDLKGDDEFARVAAGINKMAAEIERQQRDLLEAQSALEKKVEERTQALRRANAALRETAKSRQRFLADISHELRTPLTVIRGEAEVTLRGKSRSEQDYETSLTRIVEQAGLLGKLVDDLLMMARTQAGAPRLTLTAVSLPTLLTQITKSVRNLCDQQGVEIALLQPGDGPVVTGDRRRLQQLFYILIDNALRYSKPGDRIGVNVVEDGDTAKVLVTDSGVGIDDDELPHIFERFYRGEHAQDIFPEGSGLGLPMAKSIVDAHGGGISIDSRSGGGTTVCVNLPAVVRARASA